MDLQKPKNDWYLLKATLSIIAIFYAISQIFGGSIYYGFGGYSSISIAMSISGLLLITISGLNFSRDFKIIHFILLSGLIIFATQFYLFILSSPSSPVENKCAYLLTKNDKARCYFNLASVKKDVLWCEKISKPDILNSNPSQTELNDYALSYYSRCVAQFAYQDKKSSSCLSNDYQCLSRVATITKDKSTCDIVKDDIQKNHCYANVAEQTGDLKLCAEAFQFLGGKLNNKYCGINYNAAVLAKKIDINVNWEPQLIEGSEDWIKLASIKLNTQSGHAFITGVSFQDNAGDQNKIRDFGIFDDGKLIATSKAELVSGSALNTIIYNMLVWPERIVVENGKTKNLELRINKNYTPGKLKIDYVYVGSDSFAPQNNLINNGTSIFNLK